MCVDIVYTYMGQYLCSYEQFPLPSLSIPTFCIFGMEVEMQTFILKICKFKAKNGSIVICIDKCLGFNEMGFIPGPWLKLILS